MPYKNIKFMGLKMRHVQNNSGVILLSVLWSLVILTLLAVGIGRTTGINLALAKYQISQVKSKYIAWGGLHYALDQINQDSQDKDASRSDILYQCSVRMTDESTPENLFKEKGLKGGSFSISYQDEADVLQYGFQDEEKKINLNALDAHNVKVFIHLLEYLGFDEQQSQTAAYALLDWTDADHDLSHEVFGAEDEFYRSLPAAYRPKNLPLDSVDEFLLVRGVDPGLLNKAKPFITVFPKNSVLKVNFDTASREVLTAVARFYTGGTSNADEPDADSLVEKLIRYRNGEDGIGHSQDDRKIDMKEIAFNQKEQVIFMNMQYVKTDQSNLIRIRVAGMDKQNETVTYIDAVVQRDDLSILYWNRS